MGYFIFRFESLHLILIEQNVTEVTGHLSLSAPELSMAHLSGIRWLANAVPKGTLCQHTCKLTSYRIAGLKIIR